MDKNINDNIKNRTDNLYILSGFTYGPSNPDSLEETRIGGTKITVVGPQTTILVSDPFGNFSSGLLPEGQYKLSFFDSTQKYFRSSMPIFLGHDLELPVFLQMAGDKKRKERNADFRAGTPNVIHGFTLSRKKLPASGMIVTVGSVILEKQKQGLLGKALSKFTSVFKRKGRVALAPRDNQLIHLELKTNILGGFSTKKLPNGSYIVSCSDPSGKNKFSSKFVVLKGKPIAPLFFTGYTQEDLEELTKKNLERKTASNDRSPRPDSGQAGEPKEKEKLEEQKQQAAQQKLEKGLHEAQVKRAAARTPDTTLSRASRESLFPRVRMPFRTAASLGQRGVGYAGQTAAGATKAGIKGAEAGIRAGLGGARLVLSLARIAPLIAATPVGWIAAGIGVVVILIIIIIFFFGGSSVSIPGLGSLGGGSGGSGSGGSGGKTTPGLNYRIPIRDSGVVPENIRSIILANWPNAQIDNWDVIVSGSIANGWNPAFLLTLWVEESGAQGVPAADALGCDPNNPNKDISGSLTCVFKSFKDYNNDRFADFMCRYGGDNFGDAPCTFAIHNPNFPKNIRFWYEKFVPAGSPGALVEVPPLGQDPLSATCPIAGGTAATVTCGSFFTLRSSCGHCRADAGYANYMNNCTPNNQSINYAEDIGGTVGQDVFLPSINGASIDWALINSAPSKIGAIRYFSGVNKQTNEEYWIQFHHVDESYGVTAGKSGDIGARICTSSSECNHVHVEFSTVSPGGGKKSQDAPLFLCI